MSKSTLRRVEITLTAAPGRTTLLVEIAKVGERAIALGRLFNAREGFTSKDDALPWRMFNPTQAGPHAEGGLLWKEGYL